MTFVVLFLLFTTLVPETSAQPAPSEHTVSVTATGTVIREPEQVRLLFAVETTGKTAGEATAQNASKMTNVITRLKKMGLAGGQIQTANFALHPRYDHSQPRDRLEPIGFQARNTLQVTIDSVSHLGQAIDAAVAAGINQAFDLRFELNNPETAHHEALQAAVASAKAQAQTLAAAAGMRLGLPLHINTTGSDAGPPIARVQAFGKAQHTPVEAGNVQVTATVTITYHLEK